MRRHTAAHLMQGSSPSPSLLLLASSLRIGVSFFSKGQTKLSLASNVKSLSWCSGTNTWDFASVTNKVCLLLYMCYCGEHVCLRDTRGNIYNFQLFCGMSVQSIKFKTADLICYAAVCIYQGISQLSWYHCTELKKCCIACLAARKTSVSDAHLLLRSKLCLWYCCLLLMAPYERKASDLDKKHSYLFFPFGFS